MVDPNAKGNERFEAADNSKRFTAGSLSSGAVFTLTPIWSLAATLGYTERAPTFYELYANGAHVATGTYELGNPNLSKEKAVSSDLALRFDNGTHNGSVGAFTQLPVILGFEPYETSTYAGVGVFRNTTGVWLAFVVQGAARAEQADVVGEVAVEHAEAALVGAGQLYHGIRSHGRIG